MTPLTLRQQSVVGLALALLMVLTRGQHLSLAGFMPDASWAVFFLAGVYLRPVWALPAYLLLALGLDLAAVTWGGVSGYCLTPAYLLLVPAQAALWGAGRWYAARHHASWSGLWLLAATVLVASFAAELLASGGFYLFSGRFAELSAAELGSRLLAYYPASLAALAFYVGVAAGLHAALGVMRRRRVEQASTGAS
jgi:hypothetical protein